MLLKKLLIGLSLAISASISFAATNIVNPMTNLYLVAGQGITFGHSTQNVDGTVRWSTGITNLQIYKGSEGWTNVASSASADSVAAQNLATSNLLANVMGGTTVVSAIDFATNGAGLASWNYDEETLDLVLNGATLQVGQESHWHVRADGMNITNGQVVYASGTIGGASGRIKVKTFTADGSIPAMFVLGIATEDIDANTDGKVTDFGKVNDIDTSAWPTNTVLYCSTNAAGGLATNVPEYPQPKLPVAFVVNSHASNGRLAVRVDPHDDNEHYTRAEGIVVSNLLYSVENPSNFVSEINASNWIHAVADSVSNGVVSLGNLVSNEIPYRKFGHMLSANTTYIDVTNIPTVCLFTSGGTNYVGGLTYSNDPGGDFSAIYLNGDTSVYQVALSFSSQQYIEGKTFQVGVYLCDQAPSTNCSAIESAAWTGDYGSPSGSVNSGAAFMTFRPFTNTAWLDVRYKFASDVPSNFAVKLAPISVNVWQIDD